MEHIYMKKGCFQDFMFALTFHAEKEVNSFYMMNRYIDISHIYSKYFSVRKYCIYDSKLSYKLQIIQAINVDFYQ
jgi:hypothetical protein